MTSPIAGTPGVPTAGDKMSVIVVLRADQCLPAPQCDTTPFLYYNNGVAIYYTDSAGKHNVPHEDIEYTLFHPINKQ